MRELGELIEQVSSALDRHDLPHAFGGALALAQVVDPRGTVDVDVNVFVDQAAVELVDEPLAALGYRREGRPLPIAGFRYTSSVDPFPVDVFPDLDERYREVRGRVVRHPIRRDGPLLPFLSPVDLCVFKLSFGRAKDWVDLAEVAKHVPDLDVDAVEDLLVALRGPSTYPRVVRFRAFFDRQR